MGKSRYGLWLTGIFCALFAVYLTVALVVLRPLRYYGTVEKPRFSDPWIARAETILDGGLLYRDVSTTTPPLTNFLLIPPVLVSQMFDHRNWGATVAFMTYFALFNLLTALVLLYLPKDRKTGFLIALVFLLNPLTFGNAVLRRQDESILTFFFALALLFMSREQHTRASVATGLTLLVKFTGLMIVPFALLRTRNWRYLVLPFVVFGVVFAPFFALAGRAAMFWDVRREETEHPFQFDGISLGSLWHQARDVDPSSATLTLFSAVFIVGVLIALAVIALRPRGLFEDATLLATTVLLLSPKLHCGYLSLLALMMAPLVVQYRRGFGAIYILFGLVALIADMFKFPLRNLSVSFNLMTIVYMLLFAALVWVRWPTRTLPYSLPTQQLAKE